MIQRALQKFGNRKYFCTGWQLLVPHVVGLHILCAWVCIFCVRGFAHAVWVCIFLCGSAHVAVVCIRHVCGFANVVWTAVQIMCQSSVTRSYAPCWLCLDACDAMRIARFLARDSERRSRASLRRCMSTLWYSAASVRAWWVTW